jgi:hypothetical protein
MLQAEHQKEKYAGVSFAKSTPTSQTSALLRVVTSSTVIETDSARLKSSATETGAAPVDEFLARFEQVRQRLSYRRLMGERLTLAEDAVLTWLTRKWNDHLVPPMPERPEVTQAVEEAKLILQRLSGG